MFEYIGDEATIGVVFPIWLYIPRIGKFRYMQAMRKTKKFLDTIITSRRRNAYEVFILNLA